MKRSVFKLVSASFMAMVLTVTLALPAFADRHGNQDDDLKDVVTKAGDRLLATQGTFGGIENTWEWYIGDGTGPNLQGICATGLLAAYEKSRNRAYLDAAKKSGDTLKERYAAAPDKRPYAQDVEFLVRLYQDSRDKSYLETAKDWYAVLMDQYTAEANVDRHITARGSLTGWDVAAHIRAAYATGYKDFARAMADEVISRSAEWVNVPYPGTTDWDCTNLSYGSLIWALNEIGYSIKYKDAINDYRDYLLNTQLDDGSWEDDYQTTAYVILGLSSIWGKSRDIKNALSAACDFLVENQASNGGWEYIDGADIYEYPEIDSECAIALASLRTQDLGQHDQHEHHNNNHDNHNNNNNNHNHNGHHGPR